MIPWTPQQMSVIYILNINVCLLTGPWLSVIFTDVSPEQSEFSVPIIGQDQLMLVPC